jgi:hypothetical protein
VADAPERLRFRFRRGEVLKRVLSAYRLDAYDDGLSPGVQISNYAGDQVIARDLAEVWAAAERLTGRAVDPLDPIFTERH